MINRANTFKQDPLGIQFGSRSKSKHEHGNSRCILNKKEDKDESGSRNNNIV